MKTRKYWTDIGSPGSVQLSEDESQRERQLHALLFTLITLGYIDGTFDPRERQFVEERIQEMVDDWVQNTEFYGEVDPAFVESVKRLEKQHLLDVLDHIDQSLSRLMATEVGVDEQRDAFISSRLVLRCFEVLAEFSDEQRQVVLGLLDRLIRADGVVHPAEVQFRQALAEYFSKQRAAPKEAGPERAFDFVIERQPLAAPRSYEHPLLEAVERPFDPAPDVRTAQVQEDIALMERAVQTMDWVRQPGWDKLKGVGNLEQLTEVAPFLDCLVYTFPQRPGQRTDYIVVGDLHGCYGCLKAVLAQSDFFGRVIRYRNDPDHEPDVKLIFLGDYLDRGRWGFEGVVRTVFKLFVTYPSHVIPLVGNHEWLMERDGQILSSVRPADAIETWSKVLPRSYFVAAKNLFDRLGSVVLLDRIVILHGGIPRHRRVEAWTGLENFNDPQIRLETCWSDPVPLAEVPLDIQDKANRFAFGMGQFTAFMDAVGARVMIRGHEKVEEGFHEEYDDGRYKLYTLFSSGGFNNRDIPENCDYRNVQPHFLLIREEADRYVANPVRIAWENFNDPRTNRFLTQDS